MEKEEGKTKMKGRKGLKEGWMGGWPRSSSILSSEGASSHCGDAAKENAAIMTYLLFEGAVDINTSSESTNAKTVLCV